MEKVILTELIKLVIHAGALAKDGKLKASVSEKGDSDFVTAVDFAISDFLKKELYSLYPDVVFMTEEESKHSFGKKTFILDPIDGTTNLIYDYRMSSVALAYCEDGAVLEGVVYNPFTEELFISERGKGAYYHNALTLNYDALFEKSYKISAVDRPLKRSLIEFGAGSTHKENAEENFRIAKEIFVDCLDVRRVCSTALTICYIAAGRLNGYFEKVIKPWDFAAASLILEEAGGKLSDFDGNALPLDRNTTIIAGTPTAHAYLLDKLKR